MASRTSTRLAAHTSRISLATGSVIFPLRHPIDLAEQAESLDHLSGGRLVLGAASGNRPAEFPAYGIGHESRGLRYRETVDAFREPLAASGPRPSGHAIGRGKAQHIGREIGRGIELLPKPVHGRIPLLVTGSSQQTPHRIAKNADGCLVHPITTDTVDRPQALGRKIAGRRDLVPDGEFRPAATNEWIDLVEDPKHPPTALRGGFVLRTVPRACSNSWAAGGNRGRPRRARSPARPAAGGRGGGQARRGDRAALPRLVRARAAGRLVVSRCAPRARSTSDQRRRFPAGARWSASVGVGQRRSASDGQGP
ncbi:LLM class flavin-dependent oxidoreductase [Streptomyces sp. SID3343]|uniref:LLM class flavin-dependent oxidoreductase n=1 Tax=Streptomyces sp. SID3343 TaxID=2690260 RepID=UPI0031F8A8FE